MHIFYPICSFFYFDIALLSLNWWAWIIMLMKLQMLCIVEIKIHRRICASGDIAYRKPEGQDWHHALWQSYLLTEVVRQWRIISLKTGWYLIAAGSSFNRFSISWHIVSMFVCHGLMQISCIGSHYTSLFNGSVQGARQTTAALIESLFQYWKSFHMALRSLCGSKVYLLYFSEHFCWCAI